MVSGVKVVLGSEVGWSSTVIRIRFFFFSPAGYYLMGVMLYTRSFGLLYQTYVFRRRVAYLFVGFPSQNVVFGLAFVG
jgi:hypothetical protein